MALGFADAMGTLSARQGMDLVALLFALVLGVALGLGSGCLLVTFYFSRRRWVGRRRLGASRRTRWVPRRKRSLDCWAGPRQWLAIRDSHPYIVQSALRLGNPVPCSWEEGLFAAHEQKLFISPPLAGWILVMGESLPDPGDDADVCYHFLMELSRKLGRVEFFSFNRALQHHAWVQAERGQIQRAYAWAGKTVWNQGAITREEIDLGLKCYDYGDAPPRIPVGQASPVTLNTERVPLLAARWSVDPTSIEARLVKQTHGIAGRLLQSRNH